MVNPQPHRHRQRFHVVFVTLTTGITMIVWLLLLSNAVVRKDGLSPVGCRVSAAATSTGSTTTTTPPVRWLQDRDPNGRYDLPLRHHHHHRTFRTSGPMVTITIPHDLTLWNDVDDVDQDDDDDDNNNMTLLHPEVPKTRYRSLLKTIQRTKHQCQSIIDTTLLLLQPNCVYTVQTIPGQLPLPYWFPALKSCIARFGYSATTSMTNSRARYGIGTSRSHTPTIASDTAWPQSNTDQSSITGTNRCYIEGMTKWEWNPRFFRQRNHVLQIAIQPYQEWITTTSTTSSHRTRSPTKLQESSSSSVLFHAKSGNENYAWLRLVSSSSSPSSSSSSVPSITPVSMTNMEHTGPTTKTTLNRNCIEQSPPSLYYPRTYETSIRASTLIPIPMASLSSLRMTPTIRWIQQRGVWSPGRTPSTTLPPGTNHVPTTTTHRRHQYDTSCEMELTSGGSGRTTATLTLTPFSNMMTSTTTKPAMSLAMEYRLSGGFRQWRLRRPWNRTSRNGSTTAISTNAATRQEELDPPQHWIRQIWEWHPHGGGGSSSTDSSTGSLKNRARSVSNGIMASQYQWWIVWPSGQSLRTVFDPPNRSNSNGNRPDEYSWNGGVSLTWTDPTHPNQHDIHGDHDSVVGLGSGDGTWITDIRIPFARRTSDHETRTEKSLLRQNLLAAEIRVRRQFRF